MYILNEKLTSTLAVYMIIKRVMRNWENWPAYKCGIIDNKGKRLRRPKTSKERESWDILDRFCWSIKRLCTKYLGDSSFAYLFSMVYLMKEQYVPVVTANFERYKSELDDFTTTKQKLLYDSFVEMKKQNLIFESKLDRETNVLKIINKTKSIIDTLMIEEDVMGTTLGDIAQFTPRISNIQRRVKCRIKKRNKYYYGDKNEYNTR